MAKKRVFTSFDFDHDEDLYVDPECLEHQRKGLDDQWHKKEGLRDGLVVCQEELDSQHCDKLPERISYGYPALVVRLGSRHARRDNIITRDSAANIPPSIESSDQWQRDKG